MDLAELLSELDSELSDGGPSAEIAAALLRAHLASHLARLNQSHPGATADGEIDRLRFHIAIRTEQGRPHAVFWRRVWALMNSPVRSPADTLM